MVLKSATISHDAEYEILAKMTDASVSKHLLDEHFTLIAANERYYAMFGYTREEYEDKFQNRPDIFYKDDQKEWKETGDAVTKALTEGKNQYEILTRMRHKDGRKLWIKLYGRFTDDYINGSQISYTIMIDMSETMNTQIEQEATQNNFPGLIAKYKVVEDGFECLSGNDNFRQVFREKNILKVKDMDEKSGLLSVAVIFDQLLLGNPVSFTINPPQLNGKRSFYQVNAECIDWINSQPIYLLIYNDITTMVNQQKELKEYNESLHKLAYSDELTEGFNRRKFDGIASETIVKNPPNTYQMVWLNMQKFKVVNDMGGVEAGDRVLRYVHKKILENLHEGEYTARLFSDNFILLMHNQEEEESMRRLNHLAVDINSFNVGSDYKYYLTFTAGVYCVSDPELPIIYMEDRAHAARQKNVPHGGDLCSCSFYSEDILQKMLDEKNLENRMRGALKNREFEVYLQPKYELQTNHIAGAEALIRWNDPTRGIIPPNDFIPLFENNGFIVDLDLFVFEEVCRLLDKWNREGHAILPISVNMSRVHFTRTDFLKEYINIRDRYQIPKNSIEVELTETMIFENPEEFASIITELHKAGFPCSMDDFGSGYSTLNILKDLDFDVVKLDRAFFSNENMDNSRENVIVHSVVDMAKALEITTVAEGIETPSQLNFLRNISCDLIQGFVFSKPIPIPDFEKLYEKQKDKTNSL